VTDIQTITLDALMTKIRWKQDGKVRREQFCGRTPEELQTHVDERIAELRREK